MITQGLSKHEITLITQILDQHGAKYEVAAKEGSEGSAEIRAGRGDSSFYAIEIPPSEYEKLPSAAKTKLENLGIYPEMEAPDFSEETPKAVKPPEEIAALKKKHKTAEYIIISVLLIGLALFVRKVIAEQ